MSKDLRGYNLIGFYDKESQGRFLATSDISYNIIWISLWYIYISNIRRYKVIFNQSSNHWNRSSLCLLWVKTKDKLNYMAKKSGNDIGIVILIIIILILLYLYLKSHGFA